MSYLPNRYYIYTSTDKYTSKVFDELHNHGETPLWTFLGTNSRDAAEEKLKEINGLTSY